MQISALDLGPVKNGVGLAFNTFKDWSKWIGREVFVLASKGFQLIKVGALGLLALAKKSWEVSKPLLYSMGNFLRSGTGLVSLSLAGALLLGFMALKIEDNSGRLSLLGLSYLLFGFSLIYGCQAGVIPLLM